MRRWIGTSWKMNKTRREAREYSMVLRDGLATVDLDAVRPFVIPPFTAIDVVRAALGDSPVLVGAQNAHWEDSGAWTGEVSMPMVKDAGAVLVEIGHAERRRHFAETDDTVNRKTLAALRHDLTPLVCVGDDAEARSCGRSAEVVVSQLRAALTGVEDSRQVLVAYEPVWAIGGDGHPATSEDIEMVTVAIRDEVGSELAGLLYGGSVSAQNAASVLATPGIDGVFVGRAAWDPEGFLTILRIGSLR